MAASKSSGATSERKPKSPPRPPQVRQSENKLAALRIVVQLAQQEVKSGRFLPGHVISAIGSLEGQITDWVNGQSYDRD